MQTFALKKWILEKPGLSFELVTGKSGSRDEEAQQKGRVYCTAQTITCARDWIVMT